MTAPNQHSVLADWRERFVPNKNGSLLRDGEGVRSTTVFEREIYATLDSLEEQYERLSIAIEGERSGARIDFERAERLEEQLEALRKVAEAYLSVPSGPGDWSQEEQAARQELSRAADVSFPVGSPKDVS